MKQIEIAKMTVDQLVDRFFSAALEQDQALLDDDIPKVNRLFDKLEDVEGELKARTGDQRTALLQLFSHPNAHVRLKAAKATLAVAPKRARRMLQDISDSKEYPQAGEAGMSLRNLDRGVFIPT